MPDNNFLTGCPVDCDDVLTIPATTQEQDCTSYTQTLSQVSDLFLRPDGAPDIFASWATTPTYVASSVDNTVGDNSKSTWLVGIGGIAVPEKNTVQYPKGKTKTIDRDYPLVFRVLNLTPEQYDLCRAIQCGATGFSFYYADRGDWVYGKSGGIVPASVDVDFPKGDGEADVNQAIITLHFKADGDPERRVNPFAG